MLEIKNDLEDTLVDCGLMFIIDAIVFPGEKNRQLHRVIKRINWEAKKMKSIHKINDIIDGEMKCKEV